ncbi:thiaminase II [Enterococcus sp. DIV2402]|uniref:Aminopyrimidine aminohydrolase n=1 Tax=Candidatus Enterococcus lowellii TaxID=2230877 RepID=A0ABZ2SJ59_9ENTE|nr:thiaminase II [Enterococcus sp. DIV2402]MBO0465220.1 thiaminase II [Enterococcus sp. DIV2402]
MDFVTIARDAAQRSWENSLAHPFIQELHQGTLSESCFRYYLLQDRYYLESLQSVYLAIGQQTELPQIKMMMEQGAKRLVAGEISIRETFFERLQITEQEVQQTPLATVPKRYVAHMHQQLQHSVSVAFASLLPCAWLYQEIGLALSSGSPHPVYQRWIETCITPESMAIVAQEKELLNQLYQKATASERHQMIEAFVTSVKMEEAFWDMAYYFNR